MRAVLEGLDRHAARDVVRQLHLTQPQTTRVRADPAMPATVEVGERTGQGGQRWSGSAP